MMQNRVLAFHRWVEGEGHDVIVVVHLATFNRFGYRIGFPGGGEWREVFNSDVYENWVNPNVVGNGGRVSGRASAAARVRPTRPRSCCRRIAFWCLPGEPAAAATRRCPR